MSERIEETRCRKCGYNLRGLNTDSRCPECSTPIGLSNNGDLLRYSDPAWVTKLANGIGYVLYGVQACYVPVAFLSILSVINFVSAQLIMVAVALGNLTGNILILAGAWLLTEADPSGFGEDSYGTVRKTIRIALAAGLANSFLGLPTQLMTLAPSTLLFIELLHAVSQLFSLAGMAALFHYLSKLAKRIPDPGASWRAQLGTVLFTGGQAAWFVCVTDNQIDRLRRAASAAIGVGRIQAIISLVGLVDCFLFAFAMMLIWRFRRGFKEQAIIAKQIWAQAKAVAAAREGEIGSR